MPRRVADWINGRSMIAGATAKEGLVTSQGEECRVGSLGGSPAAIEAVTDEILAATHDARVLSSRDGGKSWRAILD